MTYDAVINPTFMVISDFCIRVMLVFLFNFLLQLFLLDSARAYPLYTAQQQYAPYSGSYYHPPYNPYYGYPSTRAPSYLSRVEYRLPAEKSTTKPPCYILYCNNTKSYHFTTTVNSRIVNQAPRPSIQSVVRSRG